DEDPSARPLLVGRRFLRHAYLAGLHVERHGEVLVDHLPFTVAPGPDPTAAHPGSLHLALGIGPAAVVEHAAVRHIAAGRHVQFMGLETPLALAMFETALPVGAVVGQTDELQRA